MKLIIAGHGRHGKDEVCNILTKRGMTFKSSSEISNELFIFDKLKKKYGYTSLQECFEDRSNHRKEWHDLICKYNEKDPAKLARKIFENNDIYAGIRNPKEFQAAKDEGLFNVAIWVDASERLPDESEESNKMKESHCDYTINNNGPLENLEEEVEKVLLKIHEDQKEEIAMRNSMIQQQREVARRNIINLIAPKAKLSKKKAALIKQEFDRLENHSIMNAEISTELLEHDWPLMEDKLETLEEVVRFFDKKYISSVNPEKSSKKEIIENTELFLLENLFTDESDPSKIDESNNSIDKVQEMTDEAKKGFDAVSK